MAWLVAGLRPLLVLFLGVYFLLYPGSLVLVALDRVPVWGTWMGGALLIWQGALMGIWLVANYGRRGMFAAALVLLLSWAIEHVGATTGFPFGTYSYTDRLAPQIFGVVPLAIPFAWLLIVTAAMGVSEQVLEKGSRPTSADLHLKPTKVLTAASFALLLDVTIEPFAVHINQYWVWQAGASYSGYYGIPASNFAAWWVTSLVLVWVMLRLRQARARAVLRGALEPQLAVMPWLPLSLYLANLTMFVVVNLARGQVVAALIGGLILAFLAADWAWPRLRGLVPSGPERGAG
jgi:bisanhydrobacterioruberin hydratase